MKKNRILTIAVLAVLVTGAAQAQIRNQQPAEFPPASYQGKQYVDSKGCVFIRAGIDGDVSWIPRMTRARQPVCGFKPTLGSQVAAAAPAAPVARPATPKQITVETPAPAPRSAAPTPPVVVRQTAPAPRVLRKQRVVVAAPAPAPMANAAPRTATITAGVPLGSDGVTAHTRIVPKHVAIRRLNTTNVTIPPGYVRAWDDGRLNPERAEQSLAGRQDMLYIWTNSVPRRLTQQATGRDVTAEVPLVYPYLDIATQRRDLGEVIIVQRNGERVKRIIRNTGAAPTHRKPVYSSRSVSNPQAAAPKTSLHAKASSRPSRYVRIGHFTTEAKARQAAQYLAGMGMGARIGEVRRGGTTYMTVQAGPFAAGPDTQRAVSRLRGAGYTGAAVRN